MSENSITNGKTTARAARVPPALTTDSSDVADALDVARALWGKGDKLEAIRWLNRAAEAAVEVGDASRAAALTRAAAELDATSAVPSPSGASDRAETPHDVARAEAEAARPPNGVSSASAALGGMHPEGVRVSVKTSVRDADLLIVRPLPAGKSPPPGTREARLVFAEQDDAVRQGPANGGAQHNG